MYYSSCLSVGCDVWDNLRKKLSLLAETYINPMLLKFSNKLKGWFVAKNIVVAVYEVQKIR